jgi:CsoR family transcriptional regulator, copper-sensing transcriptional repressor
MHRERQKREIISRLRKIEGQVRGLQKMVEGEVACSDILIQVAAAHAAMKKIGMVVIETSMEECLEKNQKGSGVKETENFKDLQ